MTAIGEVEISDISVPAELGYVRVLRLATAGVLSLFEFDHQFVEDVKGAVGEAAALVLGTHGAPGRLRLTMRCDDDCVGVALRGRFDDRPEHAPNEDDLAEVLLEPLVDSFEIDRAQHAVTFEKRP